MDPRGLFIVHTGQGKGKTTAALGMLLRSLAHGHRCAVFQFIKGEWETGEQRLRDIAAHAGGTLIWQRCGAGFTWKPGALAENARLAQGAWSIVQAHLVDPGLRFLLLDELNLVLHHGFLRVDDVLRDLRNRVASQHVVLTGRHAPEAILEAADLVTEMREVKHPFHHGVPAQAGIEF